MGSTLSCCYKEPETDNEEEIKQPYIDEHKDQSPSQQSSELKNDYFDKRIISLTASLQNQSSLTTPMMVNSLISVAKETNDSSVPNTTNLPISQDTEKDNDDKPPEDIDGQFKMELADNLLDDKEDSEPPEDIDGQFEMVLPNDFKDVTEEDNDHKLPEKLENLDKQPEIELSDKSKDTKDDNDEPPDDPDNQFEMELPDDTIINNDIEDGDEPPEDIDNQFDIELPDELPDTRDDDDEPPEDIDNQFDIELPDDLPDDDEPPDDPDNQFEIELPDDTIINNDVEDEDDKPPEDIDNQFEMELPSEIQSNDGEGKEDGDDDDKPPEDIDNQFDIELPDDIPSN